ncbi:MAG: class I SAM-dependent methyltransferase [Candidatus Eremiobacteraeota bacterium]|nr:class I SAM-dependent methyltransferase [Candidatus Eremiobacteraeota bacterium]
MAESDKNRPSWDGELQRSRLSGFARLRAIFWRRSLRLYEWWALKKQPWARKLHSELNREFQGINLDDPGRLTDSSRVFGETPLLTVSSLLDFVEKLSPPEEFLDLGSGRGGVTLAAACRGFRATGVELEADWVERAQRVAERLHLSATFRQNDFLEVEWPDSAVVFVVATAFDLNLREAILKKVKGLSKGSLLIAGDWTAPEGLERLWEGRLPVDWGVIPFAVYRV